MNGLVLIFVLTLVIMAWRGWRLGVRQVLIQSMASVIALVASTVVTPILVRLFGGWISPSLIWLGGGIVIFVLVLIWATWMLRLALEPLQPSPLASKTCGLLLNTMIGVLVAGLLVWSGAFIANVVALGRGELVTSEQIPLERWAGREMQWLATWSARASHLGDLETSFIGAIAENSGAIIGDIQRLALSPELATLLRDSDAQLLMRQSDYAAIRELPAFIPFMSQVPAQDLRSRIEAAGYANGEDAIVRQMSHIWRGYDSLQHDEQIQRILAEGNLVEQMAAGNQAAILLNPAFPQLVHRLTELMEGATLLQSPTQAEAPLLYRWQSEDDTVHYSPWAEVPAKFRATALPIKQP